MKITTRGLDLAKSVFQAHGIDENSKTVLVKRLHRKRMIPFFSKPPPCLIRAEACATAHHCARTLIAMGHEARLMPPSFVKGYVKRGKGDALDAEAICEAVQRPTMRFVPVKTVEQQGILVAHRTRSLLVRQRTMAANALRAHLAEFGLAANPGIANLVKLADRAFAGNDLPSYARRAFEILIRRLAELTEVISMLDRELRGWHAENEASRRLAAIPGVGVGVITATAIAATVTDPGQFRSGRQFAAWLGLTPQQRSTGGKTRLGGIPKQGGRYLRRLLVVGATAVMRHAKRTPSPMTDRVNSLLEKKPFRLVSVALANKLARIAWAILTRGDTCRP
ncbi:IS110 family transposase [Leisingera sp. NJS204]|uniref:IS110 family transposase n=1 Tax=Leisingera sp. NJS204 TaxID=2508307 RepID=UPI001012C52B|nr:IS110 family transposase [Leisingera sp. NJS204]QAX30053.1 IS110 family transposase [Leisingera sp. NJS204]QAX31033.1 IS110 family transposase [Leisingera sp. NJS204]